MSDARESLMGFGIRHYDYFSNKRINRRMRKKGQKRVYYCESCEGYHLTSQEYYIEDYTKKKRYEK